MRRSTSGHLARYPLMMVTSQHPSPAAGAPRVPTVLVVDDEAMVRAPIAEYLRDCGYHVLEADDARQAMSLVETPGQVDLVFSDVRMPGELDGAGLAHWIRSHHPEVPVLLTSGYSAASSHLPREVGLIEKPYTQGQVLRRIQALLPPGGR